MNDALRICLWEWEGILLDVKAKSLIYKGAQGVDAVVYTDGYYPDARKGDSDEPRIGAVIFTRDRETPMATTIEIPKAVMDQWIPRKTQVVMVESIAVVIAMETFGDILRGKRVLWMMNSEAVLGAIVKGYSDRFDICNTAALFWGMVRSRDVEVYADRIPTDGNLSDGPSRGSWRIAAESGWAFVPAQIPADLML